MDALTMDFLRPHKYGTPVCVHIYTVFWKKEKAKWETNDCYCLSQMKSYSTFPRTIIFCLCGFASSGEGVGEVRQHCHRFTPCPVNICASISKNIGPFETWPKLRKHSPILLAAQQRELKGSLGGGGVLFVFYHTGRVVKNIAVFASKEMFQL